MKKIRKIAVEQNFAAISVGKLNELNEYELQLGPDVKIPGKVFCSTALGTTGSEFSFQSFARVQKPDFCIVTRVMRNFIFSSPVKVNFK